MWELNVSPDDEHEDEDSFWLTAYMLVTSQNPWFYIGLVLVAIVVISEMTK
jgi:hypothetical protein